MQSVHTDNSQTSSRQTLAKFIHITEGAHATGQARFEGSIPDYLVKYRTTVNLIKNAEEQGRLIPGMEIVASASGNARLALAYVAADRGYNLTLTAPETLSSERRKVLADLGANLDLTPAAEGQYGAVKRAEELASAEPQKYFIPQNYISPDSAVNSAESELQNETGATINISLSEVATVETIKGVSRVSQCIKGPQRHAVAAV
ncbi:MAG: pyridoxal-phosphate dependent enzyme [Desulfuromonadaceae bacterium]